MLNVGRLKVLTEVVGRGSFSAAAEALSYTQSAVSQAIARLEAETGTTLVVRDRQGIRPTAAGATLVEHAETIFAQVCASHLGLPYERIKVVHGDTAVIPEGMGAFGSRAAMLGGSAVVRASL